jgi:arylsulfatase A-like enzyme
VLIKFLNKPKKINWFQGDHFILGLLLSTSILMLLTRLQLNGYLSKETYLLFGATYYDFQIVLLVGIFSFLLLFITRRNKYIHFIALLCMATLIFILAISSVLNIEIVRQIGKPITYNWLYYSDFLKSNDAKNAIKASFTPTLTSSLLYIVIGLFLASIGFSITNQSISKNNKKKFIITSAAFALIIGTGFLQVQAKEFEQPKVENPVTAFVLSWINSGDRFKIFTVEVPGDIRLKVEQMHQPKANEKIPFSDSIRNIVIFVFESTPANLVEVFDSTYRVTPNLNKWKQHAIIYENMYAHLPTTPNTMLSIISGIYPMTNYKSAVNEYPEIKIPSLPGTLKTNGWTTSLFFSSDLSYSNMDLYLKNQQIETAQDFKTISCNYRGFNSNYAKLDGLDDRCIVNRYFNWKGNVHPLKKTFSILWSNQTHYPYFFSGDEKEYTDNTGLNKYLNALEEVDVAFGELMDGLQKRRELETTLVLVVGDHGEAFGTHNQYTHAGNIYEENMKVPCLLINPLLFKGEKDNRISGMIDVAPTITNIAGIQQPYEWQGESMLGFSKRNHVFFIGPYSDFQFGSRFGNWKLIYSAANDQFKLFDVQKDPGELKDLSKNNKKIIEDEYKLMAGWVQYHNLKIADFLKK